ncbi:MAG: ATP-dependent helicase [Gorillibacterium sp.]|nr:ATP-dependent helicase [Gorillibacterium sp.]
MDLTNGLNDEQKAAVLSESNHILLMAGAGSGKTRVLTHRLAHLNLNCRVGISSIVAITFTRAAAKEMKDRLALLIGEKESKKLVCCTFHALAVRILQEWGHRLKLDKHFTIYSQEDREEIVKSIIMMLGLSSRTSVSKVVARVGKPVKEGPESAVLKEYEWQLKRFNAVDLDQLINKVNELFEKHPDVTEYYRKQWKYSFVDEFQDTNREQLELINQLNPINLFVVGDANQSIYRFTGARIENILEFPDQYPSTEVIKLEKNYRSTEQIIEAANNLISHNVTRVDMTLVADKSGEPVRVVRVLNQDAEIELIIDTIRGKSDEEHYSDYAVLARTNAQIANIRWKLKNEGIPTMVLSSADDPLKKNDIKLLTSYLDCIINRKDEMNFKRALRFPEPVLTDLQLQQAEQLSTDLSISLREALGLSDSEAVQIVAKFMDNLSHEILQMDNVIDALQCLIDELRLVEWYEERNLNNRITDLNEAKQYIAFWTERQINLGEDTSPTTFLKWLRIRDIHDKLLDDRDCVKLMTLHGSKGLEFENVFMVGMNEGVFPSQNTSDIEEERRLGYVGVTRAKKRLILTVKSKHMPAWGVERDVLPSRFLSEIRSRS